MMRVDALLNQQEPGEFLYERISHRQFLKKENTSLRFSLLACNQVINVAIGGR